jgi:tetratricopeptide (TPR) repeat protein
MNSQTLVDVSRNIVKVTGDGSFGTGFFFQPEYCITCHHVICKMNTIKIEYNKNSYDAEWSKSYSSMEEDIAVLRVPDINIQPLLCAKETTPLIKVSVYGLTQATRKSLASGHEVIGELNTIPTKWTPDGEQIASDEKKPWKRKPAVEVDVYELQTRYAGVGLSGAPVWEDNRKKVVGMFIAVQGDDPYRDLSTIGFVIPIETILRKFTPQNEISPTTTNIVINRADELFSKEKYENAIDQYSLVLKDPINVSALSNKGKCLSNLGRYRDAITYFDIALDLNPHDEVIWNNKGYALYELRDYNKAITCFDKALGIRAKYEFAWTGKGEALFDSGEYNNALYCFDEALKVNQNYYRAWSRKGQALEVLGRRDEALACYSRANEVTQENADGWNNRGFNLNQQKSFKEAIAYFDKALAINPNHVRALINKGYALNMLRRFDEAIICFNRVLEINANDTDAWYHKSIALTGLNRTEEASTCRNRVFELNPNFKVLLD